MLARELGVWDVDALMAAMPADLQDEWAAFLVLEGEALKPKGPGDPPEGAPDGGHG